MKETSDFSEGKVELVEHDCTKDVEGEDFVYCKCDGCGSERFRLYGVGIHMDGRGNEIHYKLGKCEICRRSI